MEDAKTAAETFHDLLIDVRPQGTAPFIGSPSNRFLLPILLASLHLPSH